MEIIQKSNNILRNIIPEDSIEKSHLLYGFGDSFLVEKTGKEIKEKLSIVLEKEKQEVSEYKVKLEALKTKIGEEPTKSAKDNYYYSIDGNEDILAEVPLTYERNRNLQLVDTEYVTDKPVEEVWKFKDEYDSYICKLIDCLREIKLINTILTNYPDDKKYKLPLRDIQKLGF